MKIWIYPWDTYEFTVTFLYLPQKQLYVDRFAFVTDFYVGDFHDYFGSFFGRINLEHSHIFRSLSAYQKLFSIEIFQSF